MLDLSVGVVILIAAFHVLVTNMTQETPLSPEDEAACMCVAMNRVNLHEFLRAFIISVQLFELMRNGGDPTRGELGWPFHLHRLIAAKEGALNIYHFERSLVALRKWVGVCPTTRDAVNTACLREAAKKFQTYFPNASAIRHAVAHAGEVWDNPKRAQRHVLKKTYTTQGGGRIESGAISALMLFGTVCSISWEGVMFELDMSNAAVAKLAEVHSTVEAAFQ